ncbi:MAG: MFS transporter [Acidimicrobiia bacterium]
MRLFRPTSNAAILGWVAFCSGLAQEMIYPLLPTFVVVALGTSKTTLGGIEGALAVGVTIARLGSGRLLARRTSPRRLVRWSYGLSLTARPLMAAATGPAAVTALRVADGLGKGGKDAPRDTLVAADLHEDHFGRGFGIQRALDTLGSVAGPIVAGLLLLAFGHGSAGLRTVFALSAIPGMVAMVLLRRVRDYVPPASSVQQHAQPPARLPRAFWLLLIPVTLFGLANSSDTLLLLRARDAGVSAAGLAFAYAAFNLVYAALAVPAGTLSDRIGRRPLLVVAWLGYAAVYLGFAFTHRALALIGLFLFYGVYYATADGTMKAWIASLADGPSRGRAYGYYAAASGVLTLPAGLIAGSLWDHHGPAPAFVFGSVLALLATVTLMLPVLVGHQPMPAATTDGDSQSVATKDRPHRR